METKKAIEKKLNKASYDDTTPIDDTIHPIRYIIKYPFHQTKDRRYNMFYWYLCKFLEPNTNRLVTKDINDKTVPITDKALASFGRYARGTFRFYLYVMTFNGIVMAVRVCKRITYYINPAFVTCGNTYPKGLLKMFIADDGSTFGEHLFYKNGTLRKMNRGELKRD